MNWPVQRRTAFALVCAALIMAPAARAQPIQLVNAFPSLAFTKPIAFVHSGDGTNRVFVAQQTGHIFVFQNDSTTPSAKLFLDVSGRISSPGGEEGLLGLAFHPQFASNGYFYINYTAPNPLRTVIARFKVSAGNPDSADPFSELKVLEFNQPYSNHNGGCLAFGPDGYLYIAAGDGGSGGDPQNNAQNRSVLLGKILRIDVNGTTASTQYLIPADNPFAGNSSGFREEIWAYGLRNPWRFSFDSPTATLWAGDVGQGTREEVDIIQKGKNYGWRIMEGTLCYNPSTGCDTTGLTLPVKDYGHDVGSSITGGYVYRGLRRPELAGAYIYGDFGSGRIWKLRYQGGVVTEDALVIQAPFSISSFGVDFQNELYLCAYSYSGTSGIYRFSGSIASIVPDGGPPLLPAGYSLHQNYPNPFNPATIIAFDLPVESFVTIELYSMIGEKVSTLVSETMGAGTHRVVVNAQKLPSGVYMYRMSAGRFTAARKMIAIK